jgi:hypothetical protein
VAIRHDDQSPDDDSGQSLLAPARGGGPKTPGGKKAVSRNAVTHGLYSLDPTAGGEAPENYAVFRDGIRESIRPTNMLLEELTEELAVTTWRLMRVVRYEKSELDAKYAAIDDPDSYSPPATRQLAVEEQFKKIGLDLNRCRVLLQSIDSVGYDAVLKDPQWQHVIRLLDLSRHPVREAMEGISSRVPVTTAGSLREWIAEIARACGISYVELIRSTLKGADNVLSFIERRERVRARQRHALEHQAIMLSDKEMDRVVRLEAHLERRRTKILTQIEQIQRTMAGENIPPTQRIQIIEE